MDCEQTHSHGNQIIVIRFWKKYWPICIKEFAEIND